MKTNTIANPAHAGNLAQLNRSFEGKISDRKSHTCMEKMLQQDLNRERQQKAAGGSGKFDSLIEQDSYYYNRQPQWEKSQLDFTAQAQKPSPCTPIENDGNTVQNRDKTATEAIPKRQPATVNNETTQQRPTSVQPGKQPKPTPLVAPAPDNRLLALPCQRQQTALRPIPPEPMTLRPVSPSLPQQPLQWQHHHLYRQGQEAQLALQSPHADQTSAKRLVKVVREYLQMKKVRLTQIIINGAKHD